LAEIPVIMLTMVDHQDLGYALGATDYLSKPLDQQQLTSVLRRYRRDTTSATVLVVEDDATTRNILRRMLEKEGWQVDEAANGRLGLEYLQEHWPALILLDLMMPEVDGFRFVDELRCNEKWRAIPVVVVTAKDLTAEDRGRLNGGIEKILQKGAYSREDLLNDVRDLIAACVGV
jgi:CheY-like chemotaxis protein